MHFVGHFKRKLDSQFRLVLPKAYSQGFPSNEVLLVKAAQQRCIVAIPPERIEPQSLGRPSIGMGAFQKISIKGTLRFTVPFSLRDLLVCEDVWFIGTADRLVICDAVMFDEIKRMMYDDQAALLLAQF